MKLTYWCATQDSDHQCFNIRKKTKKEVLEQVKKYDHIGYSKPFKVTINYKDAFNLMDQCLGEGGISEWSRS